MPTSVGIGYGGRRGEDTAIHEVGHAHGLTHAPCGGAGAPDPNFPYPGGLASASGATTRSRRRWSTRANTNDMMGYCEPKWISDFFYSKLFRRVRSDNKYFNDWMPGPFNPRQKRYVPFAIDGGASVHVSGAATREPWITEGEPREITWAGGSATAYWFPYDHLPGGTLYVPDEVPSGAQLRGEVVHDHPAMSPRGSGAM